MKLIYAIVVTYNGMPWIDKCLGSLRDSDHPVEILVIDNGSSDGTVARVEDHHPKAELIRTGSNLGFGRANNIGIRKALVRGGEYVFLLNQDAWVAPETVGRLVEASGEHAEYGVISPVHLNGEGTALDRGFSGYLPPGRRDALASEPLGEDGEEIVTVDFVNAAAWLVPSRCIRKVGLFEERFHMYAEDNNLIRRMRYHGYKVGVVPGAIAWHDREERGRRQDFLDSYGHQYNLFMAGMLDPNRPLSRRLYAELSRQLKSLVSSLFRGSLSKALVHLKVLLFGLPRVPGLYRRSEEYKRNNPLQ